MTTSSQSTDGALERRVATFLRAEAPAVAPPGLLEGALRQLDAAPTQPARPRPRGLLRSPEWLGLGLMAAFVVVAVGVVALGGGSGTRTGAGAGSGAGSAPDYDGIRFQASGLAIDAGAQRFSLDPATATVTSDPGDPAYSHPRVDVEAARRRDAPQPLLRQRRRPVVGAGDPDLQRAAARRVAQRHRALLRASGRQRVRRPGRRDPARRQGGHRDRAPPDRPADPAADVQGADQPASTTGPVVDPGDGGPLAAPDAFAAGQLLHCIGAESMTPQQLALYARSRGYAVEYRYLKDGYSGTKEPPAGSVLTDALWGSAGQLIIMASEPAAPPVDQVRLTAERACPAGGDGK